MLEKYKKELLESNCEILRNGLVSLTWGNVSCRVDDNIIIKPSGIDLSVARPEDMSVVDLTGNSISGLKPSVDTLAHVELYKGFPEIRSVVHTHSKFATSFAQAGTPIRCLGTTHADYFRGAIPIVPIPTWDDTTSYEKKTGEAIVKHFNHKSISYLQIPAALVESHGVFAWGKCMKSAVENAHVLELVAEMKVITLSINPNKGNLALQISDKHFFRKNGDGKYYGQG
tara:strand:- start:371 stop:1054 length:684 start_codon:yes stop_codon:yes gene_type:complete